MSTLNRSTRDDRLITPKVTGSDLLNTILQGVPIKWKPLLLAWEDWIVQYPLHDEAFPLGVGYWVIPADNNFPSFGISASDNMEVVLFRRDIGEVSNFQEGDPVIRGFIRSSTEKVAVIFKNCGSPTVVDVSIMPSLFMEGLMPPVPPGVARRLDQMYARFKMSRGFLRRELLEEMHGVRMTSHHTNKRKGIL